MEDTTELRKGSVERAVVSEKENSEEDKQTQRIEEEEVDDYFQDPTDICKWLMCLEVHASIIQCSHSQCQSLTQYPLRGSQSM